jgi:diguanylate cyclase (GGDEF)-like protein
MIGDVPRATLQPPFGVGALNGRGPIGWLFRRIDAAIPARFRRDADQLRIARLVALSAPVAALLLTVVATAHLFTHHVDPRVAALLGGTALACALLPAALLMLPSPLPAAHALPLVAFVGAALGAWLDGGLYSEALFWLPFVPLIAALACGALHAVVFAVLGIATVAAMAAFPGLIRQLGHSGPEPVAGAVRAIGASTAIVFGGLLGAAYERARARAAYALWKLATHSELTGLPGRALFWDRLERALAAAERTARPVGLVYLDLDHFKQVNDSFGHESGDELLVQVAKRLRETTRGSEAPYHLSGDEFVVLCEDESVDGLAALAARIDAALSLPVGIGERAVAIAASIGVERSRAGDTPSAFLARADAAMYRCKHRRRVSGAAAMTAQARVLH